MLEFKNISVTRGKKRVINNVSFPVKNSSITVLLGKNGSGKSTLLDTVTSQVKYSGSVLLDERDVNLIPSRERAKVISLLPQSLPETPLTVYDLASLGRFPHTGSLGVMSEEDRKFVSDSLSLTGMSDYANRPCNELSGGERQKAYLAMTLAQNSPYILLDEPTTYLDITYRKEMYELLKLLVKEHGKSLLVVMHDLNEAAALADFVCVLNEGDLSFYGETKEFLRENVAEKLFGVKKYISGDKVFFT